MTARNFINPMPYLRTTWDFPEDAKILAKTLNRSYLEIASMVNARTIGIFPENRPAIAGEAWFLSTGRNQNLRQIYPFTSVTNIPHNIDTSGVIFTKCSGSFTDSATGEWYGCIFGSNVAIAGQLSFYITPNSAPGVIDGNIVILSGAGAPPITSGIIVLEWIVRTSSSN